MKDRQAGGKQIQLIDETICIEHFPSLKEMIVRKEYIVTGDMSISNAMEYQQISARTRAPLCSSIFLKKLSTDLTPCLANLSKCWPRNYVDHFIPLQCLEFATLLLRWRHVYLVISFPCMLQRILCQGILKMGLGELTELKMNDIAQSRLGSQQMRTSTNTPYIHTLLNLPGASCDDAAFSVGSLPLKAFLVPAALLHPRPQENTKIGITTHHL